MSIVEKIAAAGVVGCGGAGFPTHKKLSGNIEYFIVNAAECEPLLRTDRYLMLNKAPELVKAIEAIGRELKIPHCVIATKAHYHDEIASLRQAIAAAGAPIEICEMDSFYPAGDEQTIVYEVTGRVVPPAGIPIAVGAVVNNVATVYAVYEAMEDKPFTHKFLTVTGEVKHPVILYVPVGTPFRSCIELAGGATIPQYFVVSGGPMMGQPVPMDKVDGSVVTKTTSGILVLPADGHHANANKVNLKRMLNTASSACCQCSNCTQLCPRHMLGHPLQPHKIMRKVAMSQNLEELLQDPDIRNAALCCECGICEEYACPMGIFPRKINSALKRELGKAGIRYSAGPGPWEANVCREDRKAPSDKVAARVGVAKYNHYTIRELVSAESPRVEIPLRMHIGAPSQPVVTVGERVEKGQLLAEIPDGALGARIHASISGRVVAVGERIIIEKE